MTEANKAAVNSKVDAATGADATTVAQVQTLVDTTTPPLPADNPKLVAALAKIAAYADNATNPAPSAQDYADAGVTGIGAAAGQPTLAMLNSVLASAAVTGREADTTSEVQALVNAYAKVLAMADRKETRSRYFRS